MVQSCFSIVTARHGLLPGLGFGSSLALFALLLGVVLTLRSALLFGQMEFFVVDPLHGAQPM